MRSKQAHFKAVEQVRAYLQTHVKTTTLKLSHTHTFRKKKGVDLGLGKLNCVLQIEADRCTVEPSITMEALVAATLKIGKIPPVVPEFKKMTVGGAINGGALESSSHKYGEFHESCLAYEVLLGSGEVITASPEENSDLFRALPGSYGTLGILTAVTLKLIPAKKYVDLFVHPNFSTYEGDFVEGLVLSPDKRVTILGTMTDRPTHAMRRLDRWYSRWFYTHLEHQTLPIKDYLFRYDLGAFWMGRHALKISLIFKLLFRYGDMRAINAVRACTRDEPPFFTRLLFGHLFRTAALYKVIPQLPHGFFENLFFVHDFYVPKEKIYAAIEEFAIRTKIYPIWLCPVGNYINLGLYGIPQGEPRLLAQELERKVVEMGGRKMLYSHNYMDRGLFSQMFDETNYLVVKKKYDTKGRFPTLYEKVVSGT